MIYSNINKKNYLAFLFKMHYNRKTNNSLVANNGQHCISHSDLQDFPSSTPIFPVQTSVLDGFRQMVALNPFIAFKIGNRARNLQDSVVCTS